MRQKRDSDQWRSLQGFLQKFHHIIPRDKKIRDALQEIIYHEFNVEIAREHIDVKFDSVYIQASSLLKNEIRSRQKDILLKLHKLIPDAGVKRIG